MHITCKHVTQEAEDNHLIVQINMGHINQSVSFTYVKNFVQLAENKTKQNKSFQNVDSF